MSDTSTLNASAEAAEPQQLAAAFDKASLSNPEIVSNGSSHDAQSYLQKDALSSASSSIADPEIISNGSSHDAQSYLHKDALSSASSSIADEELSKNGAEELTSKASVEDISSSANTYVHGSRLEEGREPADCEVVEKDYINEGGVERWPQEIEEVVDPDKEAGNGTYHDVSEEVGAAPSERDTPLQVFPVPNIGSSDNFEIAKEPRDTNQDMSVPERNLILGKQHQDEDDTSTSWRKHKKHFFILSNAGKPIYSRYGDEHKLAGFSATLQAIISFVENSGDCIRFIRAGDHQIVFSVKGPLYLVAISATDEPVQTLRGQLELLYGQLILILTKSLEKCFVKNANFDARPLLGGTEIVFSSLIRSFSWNFGSFLHSYTCLPLADNVRQAAGAALQDIADSDLLFALLLGDSKVITLVEAPKASLHPDDILLLSNFVSSLESFRTTESFTPVCLPTYNPMAFLYAYVHYLETNTCLILITANSNAFFHLKECRAKVESFLLETRVLSDIANSVTKGGLRVEDLPGNASYGSVARSGRLFKRKTDTRKTEHSGDSMERGDIGGAAGLAHFIYRSIYLDQYVASEFSPPLHTKKSQKRLFRAYERLYASMHCGSEGSHQMQYRRDEHHVLLGWSTADFEFFAAFDPLAEKSSAITVCNRACQWIRDAESDIFYTGTSPFNW